MKRLQLIVWMVLMFLAYEGLGQKYHIISGTGWKATSTSNQDWMKVFYNDAGWGNSALIPPPPAPFTIPPPVTGTNHMWYYPYADSVFFRTSFELKSNCFKSGFLGTVQAHYKIDNEFWLYVNGQLVDNITNRSGSKIINSYLRIGKNVIAIKAYNERCSGSFCPYHMSFGVDIDYLSGPEIQMDPDKNACEGDSVTFGPKDHYQSYLWSNGATSRNIKVGKAGKYYLTAKDTAGCNWIDTVELITYPHKKVNIGKDRTVCTGDVVKFDAGKGYASYLWSTGDTTDTISVNYAGTFWVSVTDNNGCSSTDTASIEIFDHATVSLGEDTTLCKGDTLVVSASFPLSTYKWDDGSIDTFRVITQPGVYSVTITNYCGQVSDNIIVDYINSISVDLGGDAVFCNNQPYQITADVVGAIRYTWNTGDSTYQISVKEPGYYSVEVEDQCGNIGQDEIEIIHELHPSQMVPNSFTPNSDGLNETWKPAVKTYGHYLVTVVDRWGKVVFQSEDLNAEWDGKVNGNPVEQGTYNYRIELVNCEFQTQIFTGKLTVLR